MLLLKIVSKMNRDEVNNPCDYLKKDKQVEEQIDRIWSCVSH